MSDILTLWFLLVIGHFVADYPLQSDFIAKGKNRFRPVDPASIPPGQTPQTVWPWVLTAHAGTHAAATYLVLGSPILALCELIAHWLIDYGKCANRYGIHADQIMHLVCKAVWALAFVWSTAP
ncbi:MAG: DUF3307 domain-containing protein [Desulfurellales bacterium]|nr:MAG: DUF3307 domain-containing protein [Desulfurellales bacterium]